VIESNLQALEKKQTVKEQWAQEYTHINKHLDDRRNTDAFNTTYQVKQKNQGLKIKNFESVMESLESIESNDDKKRSKTKDQKFDVNTLRSA